MKDKNKEDNAYRISYNETMSTSAGIVTFSNEMKLLNENKTYKIDWSSKLIFPELNDTDKVVVDTLASKKRRDYRQKWSKTC